MRSLRTQLALVMLATVLVPLGLVAILSWQLLEAASSLGFHREVEEALRLGAEEARERHRAELAAVRAALHAAGRALAEPTARAGCEALAQNIVSLGLQATC